MFAGSETKMRQLRRAECCGCCRHCIARHPWDDPIMYGCAVETEPSDGREGEKNKNDPSSILHLDAEWWNKNWTRPYLVCPLFAAKDSAEIEQEMKE